MGRLLESRRRVERFLATFRDVARIFLEVLRALAVTFLTLVVILLDLCVDFLRSAMMRAGA